MAKNVKDLSEPEILALAIANEETDGRIYADFAGPTEGRHPATARIFNEMEADEESHRRRLVDEYRRLFGGHILLIRREDVRQKPLSYPRRASGLELISQEPMRLRRAETVLPPRAPPAQTPSLPVRSGDHPRRPLGTPGFPPHFSHADCRTRRRGCADHHGWS
jgi:Rubrerythrin